ncbi:hypothetical protein [Methylobacterium gregans]|uniref:hypothetical protein n=1 Tax=Methylobacterium gregans TaxID=374424 RepID=UPI0036130A18
MRPGFLPVAGTPATGTGQSGAASRGVSIAYGAGVYVAVGAGGFIYTTTDLINGPWTKRTSPTTADLGDVCFGNGVFTAVGTGGVTVWSATGTGGWTLGSGLTATVTDPNTGQPVAIGWNKLAFGNNVFVAIASVGASYAWSADGKAWTTVQANLRFSGAPETHDVCFGAGYFVMTRTASNSNNVYAVTSADGAAWTQRASLGSTLTQPVVPIAFGNGTFIVGQSNNAPSYIYWHTNPLAANWNFYNVGSYGVISAVFCFNTQFLFLAGNANKLLSTYDLSADPSAGLSAQDWDATARAAGQVVNGQLLFHPKTSAAAGLVVGSANARMFAPPVLPALKAKDGTTSLTAYMRIAA